MSAILIDRLASKCTANVLHLYCDFPNIGVRKTSVDRTKFNSETFMSATDVLPVVVLRHGSNNGYFIRRYPIETAAVSLIAKKFLNYAVRRTTDF